mgnify:CR=1
DLLDKADQRGLQDRLAIRVELDKQVPQELLDLLDKADQRGLQDRLAIR